jgi:hypothetical protein
VGESIHGAVAGKNDSPIGRRHALESEGEAMALRSPKEALEKIAGMPDGWEKVAFVRGVFEALSTLPPKDVLAYAKELKDPVSRRAAMEALVSRWTTKPSFEGPGGFRLDGFIEAGTAFALMSERPELAAEVAMEMVKDERARGFVMGRAAEALAKSDPSKALSLAERLPEEEKTRYMENVLEGWVSKDADAALSYAKNYPEGPARTAMMQRVAREIGKTDLAKAGQALAEIPAGKEREEAIQSVGRDAGRRDIAKVEQWISTLQGEEKLAATRGLDSVAPVGTGIRVSGRDSEFPVVRELVGGGPAEKGQQLKQGDMILAVAKDGDSRFTDTRGMGTDEISPLLRGQQGSPVQLKVRSAETNEERVITISRDRFQLNNGGRWNGGGGGGPGGPGRGRG